MMKMTWNFECTGSLNKLFFSLIIFSGLQTTGFSVARESHLSRGGGIGLTTRSPYIEPFQYNNTTVFVGQSAYITCIVHNLGDKTVSWMRKRDLHILSSGNQIYTNDKRFSLLREGKSRNSYTIKISSSSKKDEGTYECQINTDPKMTATVHLIVLGSSEDPDSAALALGMLDSPYHQKDDHHSKGYEAKILGPSLMELDQGSQLANFTCIISHGRSPSPPNISWFFNEIPIQKAKGRFSVDTEKSSYQTVSILVILKPQSGKYSCGGATVYPDSVVLKVRPRHSHSENSGLKEDEFSSSHATKSPTWFPVLFSFIVIFAIADADS
ncbi:uncharacterized protein LOC110862016 [Folsomia candida]|uniref:uncharacterized protein LOC110862016 n=1 Tax=Folsomia candida TaxID=158441 RepID=UPI001604BA6C|nr:uncharacterized protein LOC110862016 [Folsomia candida]